MAAPHPLSDAAVAQAAELAGAVDATFREAGYDVQTVRLSTRPLFDDMADRSADEILGYAAELRKMVAKQGIRYVSLGPAAAARPDFPLDRLELIPDLLIGADEFSCGVLMATAAHGVRYQAAAAIARAISRLGYGTADGLGNFRFAMLACVDPGGPFFPAAYHRGPASLSIGLQGAGTVSAALTDAAATAPAAVTERVRCALDRAATPIVHLARRFAAEAGLCFGGIDLSPAPAAADGLVEAVEAVSGAPFGEPGTLAAIGAVTEGVRTTGLPTCGFTGLMLPVLEDPGLARRWDEGRVGLQQILSYSVACGTGLDTVPLPGNVDEDELGRLLLDVATLSVRWEKPLSARLLPVRGRKPGERTCFGVPYLVDGIVHGRPERDRR